MKAEILPAERSKSARQNKIKTWELRELDEMPEVIAKLEAQQAALAAKLADGVLYRDAPDEAIQINTQLQVLDSQLAELFTRWEALEEKRSS